MKKCKSYSDLYFFSNQKVSKLPKPSLSITYHQSFNKSNLLVKNIGFRRNLTFCCISVQIFSSLNRLKLILSVLLEKVRNQDNIIGVHLEYRQKVSKLPRPPDIFQMAKKCQSYADLSKLPGRKITRTLL